MTPLDNVNASPMRNSIFKSLGYPIDHALPKKLDFKLITITRQFLSGSPEDMSRLDQSEPLSGGV
jgi:hypothetical protein